MNRDKRKRIAEKTLAIIEQGGYVSPAGTTVDIRQPVCRCLEHTQYCSPEDIERLAGDVLARPAGGLMTAIEVVNETTLAGIGRLYAEGGSPIAALNFASAKHPGGGFLRGAQAQEESLARSSALYASLKNAPAYYERHRNQASALYSDAMILSPDCPVFRDDDGELLERPVTATFITCAAPNARAAAERYPGELAEIPGVFHRRAGLVLALAAAQGYRNLVLGAWGCGAFGNDPQQVAGIFADHLLRGDWAGRFERVVFSVLDTTRSGKTIRAFETALQQG